MEFSKVEYLDTEAINKSTWSFHLSSCLCPQTTSYYFMYVYFISTCMLVISAHAHLSQWTTKRVTSNNALQHEVISVLKLLYIILPCETMYGFAFM